MEQPKKDWLPLDIIPFIASVGACDSVRFDTADACDPDEVDKDC